MGRPPLKRGRKTQTNLMVEETAWAMLCRLIPEATDRNNLVTKWVRSHIANPNSDRLLSESPLAIEILNYLEANDAPEELIKELESLVVGRDRGEVQIEAGEISSLRIN